MTQDYTDFRSIAQQNKKHYSEFTDTSLPFPWQVSEIIRTGCLFPYHDIQYRVVANYLILPGALLEVCPILFLCGKQGSGKSQVGIFASHIHNTTVFSADSTYASIRNYISNNKKKLIKLPTDDPNDLPEYKEIENNIFLVWDDLDASLLIEDKQLYRILKTGYNRSTSKIQISSSQIGQNLTFDAFSPKIISSVTNITLDSRFRELSRRCLLIETKTLEDLNNSLKAKNPDFVEYTTKHLINFSSYDFTGLHESFNKFWEDGEILRDYGLILKEVDAVLKQQQNFISADKASLIRELIAVGNVSTQFNSVREGVEVYLEFFNLKSFSEENNTQLLRDELANLLAKEVAQIDNFNVKYKARLDYTVKATAIWAFIDSLIATGTVASKPKVLELNEILLDLGWFLDGVSYRKH
jgi:hypothetical protein